MSYAIMNKYSKEKSQEAPKEKNPEFKAKKYPRPWEVELTDEQRENLRKSIEADEKKYKEINKMMAQEGSAFNPFNKKK